VGGSAIYPFEIDPPHVCFVDQRYRLKRVAWPHPGHLAPRARRA